MIVVTIRLRPYYLYAVFRQLGTGDEPVEDNSLPHITGQLISSGFADEIQLVQTFCDCCRNCPRMLPDQAGSLWGEGYRCASTKTRKRLVEVENQMRSILYDLEMRFGDCMRADALLRRAAERRPYHYAHIPEWQDAYERGVKRFAELTHLTVTVPDDLLAQREHHFRPQLNG